MTLIVVDDCPSSNETPGSGCTVSEMRVRSGPIPLNQMEVTIRSEREEFLTSQSSCVNKDQRLCKVHEVSLNVDLESGPER